MPSAEALRNYYIEQINTEGYASLEFPVNGADIDPLFTSFRAILSEVFDNPGSHGTDVVKALHELHPNRPHDSAGFLEQRRIGQVNPYEAGVSVPATEDKDLFHFTPRTTNNAREYLRTCGGMPKELRGLLSLCTELHEAVKSSVRPAFEALGIADYLLALPQYALQDIHVLRIIRYYDASAELHFDRSKFTAAVWESSDGLVGTPSNNGYGNRKLTVEAFETDAHNALYNPIAHHTNRIKLFPGAGYNRMPQAVREQSGNLKPLLHGVVNNGSGQERDAVVVFMNKSAFHTDCTVPSSEETDFSSIQTALRERQRRYGGLAV